MPEKEPTQEEAVEALEELDRAQLTKLNKEQGLGVRVLKSMSDDDLRAAIAEAMEDDEPEAEEEEPTEEESPEKAEPGGIRSRLPVSPATLGLVAVALIGGAIGAVLLGRRGSGQSEPTD